MALTTGEPALIEWPEKQEAILEFGRKNEKKDSRRERRVNKR